MIHSTVLKWKSLASSWQWKIPEVSVQCMEGGGGHYLMPKPTGCSSIPPASGVSPLPLFLAYLQR